MSRKPSNKRLLNKDPIQSFLNSEDKEEENEYSSEVDNNEDYSNEEEEEEVEEDLTVEEKLNKLSHQSHINQAYNIAQKHINIGINKNKKYQEHRRRRKDEPMEVSSKHQVPRYVPKHTVVGAAASRDPRFDPMCGELDDRIFNKTYQFVTDIKKDELVNMKKKVREVKDDQEKKSIKSAIMATEYTIKNAEKKLRLQQQMSEHRKAERQRVAEDAIKELSLIDDYEQLKASGELEKYMAKRRKKNAEKDARYLPTTKN